MKIAICAIGRIRSGPERALIDDYTARFDRTGRSLGLGPVQEIEVEPRKAGTAQEAALLQAALPSGALPIGLDERGVAFGSRDFARYLADLRDAGHRTAVFCLGGADGFDAAFRDRCDRLIAFGPMVWPHRLARVMLAEQLYRAASILAGTPYHRD